MRNLHLPLVRRELRRGRSKTSWVLCVTLPSSGKDVFDCTHTLALLSVLLLAGTGAREMLDIPSVRRHGNISPPSAYSNGQCAGFPVLRPIQTRWLHDRWNIRRVRRVFRQQENCYVSRRPKQFSNTRRQGTARGCYHN
jgi:hypothetical protein